MAHWTSISRKLFLCLTTALGLWTATVQADDFLPPEKAFAFSAKVVDAGVSYEKYLHRQR